MLKYKKWNTWLESAVGFVNYNRPKESNRKIPDEDLADDIRKVTALLGHIPTRGEYDKVGNYSSDTIILRKTWEDFIKYSCGEDVIISTPVNKRKITNEELITQLKNLKEKLGRIPLKEDLGGEDKFSASAYARAFGTFGNALVAAGLIDPLQRCCVPRQELIDELKRVYILLGHTPSIEEFLANNPMRNSSSIRLEFDSWTKALLAANIPVVKARNVSAEDVKTALRNWHVENNNDDACLEFWKIRKAKMNRKFPYSCNTISSKFPSMTWEQIMHECGFQNYVTRDHFISGRKRGNFTGLDGNEYLSGLEKEVGDFLFELKNANKIKDYEYEAEVCSERSWTCDFKITLSNNDLYWLEVDGLRNNRYNPYHSGNNEKIQFYKNNNMDFSIISYSNSNVRSTIEKALNERTAS